MRPRLGRTGHWPRNTLTKNTNLGNHGVWFRHSTWSNYNYSTSSNWSKLQINVGKKSIRLLTVTREVYLSFLDLGETVVEEPFDDRELCLQTCLPYFGLHPLRRLSCFTTLFLQTLHYPLSLRVDDPGVTLTPNQCGWVTDCFSSTSRPLTPWFFSCYTI